MIVPTWSGDIKYSV